MPGVYIEMNALIGATAANFTANAVLQCELLSYNMLTQHHWSQHSNKVAQPQADQTLLTEKECSCHCN